jgi:hypothetical protein
VTCRMNGEVVDQWTPAPGVNVPCDPSGACLPSKQEEVTRSAPMGAERAMGRFCSDRCRKRTWQRRSAQARRAYDPQGVGGISPLVVWRIVDDDAGRRSRRSVMPSPGP